MNNLPTLFLSHGSPMLAIADSPARRFLMDLGKSLPRPKAILVASAHWESTDEPMVSLAAQPETIHDFGGFPRKLYELQYPAPGAPELARRASQLIEDSGQQAQLIAGRGLDHGTWVPLSLMYPEADIPVTQISVIRGGSPADHERIGKALFALRQEGILIIGSGSLTHNLYEIRVGDDAANVPDWVSDFGDWMKSALESNRRDNLLDYRRLAPHAQRNHPTEEHLMPLFFAMGAGSQDARIHRLHGSYEYGVLAMDAYAFD